MQLLDATQMPKSAISSFTNYLEDARVVSRSVVVACSNPSRNEASIPVILSADAVILAIVRDESTFKGTEQLVKLFGPRIIGSVVLPKSMSRPRDGLIETRPMASRAISARERATSSAKARPRGSTSAERRHRDLQSARASAQAAGAAGTSDAHPPARSRWWSSTMAPTSSDRA